MSGIAGAASSATAGSPPPPPDPLVLNADWQGDVPYIAKAASGTTTGFGQWFASNTTGGETPYDSGHTVIDNPSGKLGLVGAGGNLAVTWSGFTISESETISVKFYVTDADGTYLEKIRSCLIKRTS